MTRLTLGVGEFAGFKYACRMSFNGGSDPSNYATLQHRLENPGHYSGKTLTFSGYMRANTAGVKVAFECALVAAGGTIPGGTPTNAIGVTTFTLGTAWQKFTATFTVPSLVGATFNDNSSLSFNLWLSAGSNHNARNNNLGFQSAIVDFVGLQLEEGSVATAFEQRPDSIELSLCQRYYEKSYNLGVFPGTADRNGSYRCSIVNGFFFSAGTIAFAVQKRATPAISVYAARDGSAGAGSEVNNSGVFVANRNVTPSNMGTSQFQTGSNNGGAAAGNTIEFQWTADAEI